MAVVVDLTEIHRDPLKAVSSTGHCRGDANMLRCLNSKWMTWTYVGGCCCLHSCKSLSLWIDYLITL